MLQLKNLTKIYRTKGGASVRALDDVSLTFEDKGMVFLLGKSGSGKSTLLNLCGGLDKPDSGEIIVKGRGSDTFSTSDFDSYRNTYIGFIFQEYNILNEFTVEANIALALELQGKAKDKDKIHEILQAVEMEKFAKRKPNTLSGGQKQRVAIARALVKDPEIIMADEPTGALDSNTGKQVFDTLKNLSRDKLVIVVSHDREFAEIYGDRIIELKDGKVISDVTKNKVAANNQSENISFIGNDIISVKSGSSLSAADMDSIRQFIAASPRNVLISNSESDISEFKKQARIDENGAREEFFNTRPEDIRVKKYEKDESKFIRSRLPLKHAVKIGASSMKVKPFRLFFTILLTFVAFVMFGLFSTLMLFNEGQVLGESLKKSGDEYLHLVKQYRYTINYFLNGKLESSSQSSDAALFKESEKEELWDKYGQDAVFNFDFDLSPNLYGGQNLYIQNLDIANLNDFYTNIVSGFGLTHKNSSYRTAEKILWGSYPAADNEIMISDFTFECIRNAGSLTADIEGDGTFASVPVKEYGDLQKAPLFIKGPYQNKASAFRVSGVYRAAAIPDKYRPLIPDENNSDKQDGDLLYAWKDEYTGERANGFYTYALVSDTFYDANRLDFYPENVEQPDVYQYFKAARNYYSVSDGEQTVGIFLEKFSAFPAEPNYKQLALYAKDGGKLSSLGAAEIAIPLTKWGNCIIRYFENYFQGDYGSEEIYRDWYWDKEDGQPSYYQKLNDAACGARREGDETVYLTDAQRLELYRDVQENFIQKHGLTVEFSALSWNKDEEMAESVPVVLAGFFIDPPESPFNFCAYVGKNIYDRIDFEQNTQQIVTKYDGTGGKFRSVLIPKTAVSVNTAVDSLDFVNEDDSFYELKNPIVQHLNGYIEMIGILSQVFLYVGIAMAVFSMLLLFNFISVSISYKKKEIGILRAVGARSTDVFKIFFSETVIITGICLILSLIASFVLCAVFNNLVAKELMLPLTLFVFTPVCAAILIGIAVITSVVSTIFPVYSIAKKRPVESIRSL